MKITKKDVSTWEITGYNPATKKPVYLGQIKKIGESYRVQNARSMSFRAYPTLAKAREAVKKW